MMTLDKDAIVIETENMVINDECVILDKYVNADYYNINSKYGDSMNYDINLKYGDSMDQFEIW